MDQPTTTNYGGSAECAGDDDDFTPAPFRETTSSGATPPQPKSGDNDWLEFAVVGKAESGDDDWLEFAGVGKAELTSRDGIAAADTVEHVGKGCLLKGTSAQAILSLNTPARLGNSSMMLFASIAESCRGNY